MFVPNNGSIVFDIQSIVKTTFEMTGTTTATFGGLLELDGGIKFGPTGTTVDSVTPLAGDVTPNNKSLPTVSWVNDAISQSGGGLDPVFNTVTANSVHANNYMQVKDTDTNFQGTFSEGGATFIGGTEHRIISDSLLSLRSLNHTSIEFYDNGTTSGTIDLGSAGSVNPYVTVGFHTPLPRVNFPQIDSSPFFTVDRNAGLGVTSSTFSTVYAGENAACKLQTYNQLESQLKFASIESESSTGDMVAKCSSGLVRVPSVSCSGKTVFPFVTLTIPAGAGPFNDVAIPSNSTNISITNNSTAGSSITGFTGGVDGRVIVLVYNRYGSANDSLVLAHDSASSSAANRVLSPTGADITLSPNPTSSATLTYDGSISRWILLHYSP